MKAWIIGLLAAQLVVSANISTQLVDLRSTIMQLRGDMNLGLIELKSEMRRQGGKQ